MVHRPVLLESVLHYLAPERGGWFVDGTVGGGGHAEAIRELLPTACLLGLVLDPSAWLRRVEDPTHDPLSRRHGPR
jgi:16S rRNA (cytosine1402-N4)-methyltransferase